ncbi:hypothetical protein VTK73DRAFT_5195 [Phialemonium thermophilum]|uniref:Erythromycin esterase n=1 Tax=Phialemonium thermophilum TaxID=223376 RepID=A0ABR3WQ74_9PEZI
MTTAVAPAHHLPTGPKDKGTSSKPSHEAVQLLREHAIPLADPTEDAVAFGRAFAPFADSRVVLLGGATHGTHEFQAARAAITRHLVARHGFNVVAIEADWPDAEVVDRYVRRRPMPASADTQPLPHLHRTGRDDEGLAQAEAVVGRAFDHFPVWVWRNRETAAFVEWLREHNKGKGPARATGFHGLDLYSMGASMRAVVDYLAHVDGRMAQLARRRYGRLAHWVETPADEHPGGVEELAQVFQDHEGEVVAMLRDLLAKRLEYARGHLTGEEFHTAEQNAKLVEDSQHYFRALHRSDLAAWNSRAKHMYDTLNRLLDHKGPKSKAVVWVHNSHAGDARATSQGWEHGQINLAQLCKEDPMYGFRTATVGCFAYAGQYAAANEWGGDVVVKELPRPLGGDGRTHEELAHEVGVPRFLVDLRDGRCEARLREEMSKIPRLQRCIGVIHPSGDGHEPLQLKAQLSDQFDGFVWFDQSTPIKSLKLKGLAPETPVNNMYPSGL